MNKFMRKFRNGCVLDVIDAEENTVGSDAGFSDEFMTAGEMRIEINYCSNIFFPTNFCLPNLQCACS